MLPLQHYRPSSCGASPGGGRWLMCFETHTSSPHKPETVPIDSFNRDAAGCCSSGTHLVFALPGVAIGRGDRHEMIVVPGLLA